MSGWIKLNRSIQSNWIYNERRKFSKLEAWLDMLMTVNYADNKVIIKGKLYEVKRGQSINSMDTWAKRWSWDKSAVRRFLTLLQNDNMISIISDSITTHITICKYESYQGEQNTNETQTKHKRNTDEFQTTPIKEGKEGKEIKNVNKYGINLNILLSDAEYEKLILDYSEFRTLKAIDYLSNWALEKPSKFKEYKNHNLTLRRWVFEAIDKLIKPKTKEELAAIDTWFERSRFEIEMKYKTIEQHNVEVNNKGYDTKYIMK